MNIEQVLTEVDPNVLVAAATVVLATIIYGKCIVHLGKSGSKEHDSVEEFWGLRVLRCVVDSRLSHF